MSFDKNGILNRAKAAQQTAAVMDEGLRAYMLKVYNYMATGVLLTGIIALLTFKMSVVTDQSGAIVGLTQMGNAIYLSGLTEMLVKSMRYPPLGIRGVGGAGARATGFSSHADYLTTADDEMCLVVQIETKAGLDALDDILTVDGVDAVFIGPSDLSANLGHIGNVGAPEVVTAVATALDKIAASDKASGIMALDPAAAKGYLARGVDFVAVSIDARTLALGLRATAADMRAG